jgi:tRNA(Arg) A34 adenosine deaminase TadA
MAKVTAGAAETWAGLDAPSAAALRLGWEAFQTGNIGVGAVVTDPGGAIVASGRNRVMDTEAPPGEVAGCSLAHAEINALAGVPFRGPRELTLTTTLQPCFQCAAAIRMAPIAHLRIVGADPLWDGCHDFTGLNAWLARRAPVPVDGPRVDEVGAFAVLMARLGPGLIPHVAVGLRERGEGPILDLVEELSEGDTLLALADRSVDDAFEHLWPRLQAITA